MTFFHELHYDIGLTHPQRDEPRMLLSPPAMPLRPRFANEEQHCLIMRLDLQSLPISLVPTMVIQAMAMLFSAFANDRQLLSCPEKMVAKIIN